MTEFTGGQSGVRPGSDPALSPRRAPAGFSKAQWQAFRKDGFITIENAISPEDVQRYLEAIDRACRKDPKFEAGKFYSPENAAGKDPVFEELIDHPRHIGFMYDIYGELLKLHLSQFMLRPKGGWYNLWHPDGPRAVPYNVFASGEPVVTKVAYWLTDLPRPRMGNLVLMPGSHRSQYFDGYDTDASLPGEHIVQVPKGSMTIVDARVWHRVEPNDTDIVRKNFFYAYCVSWVVPQDRHTDDKAWLAGLSRERRIIMRSYGYPYSNCKPPEEDFPLYLERDSGLDRDPGTHKDHVSLGRRKRKTAFERGTL